MSEARYRRGALVCYSERGAAYIVNDVRDDGKEVVYDLISPAGAMVGVKENMLQSADHDRRYQARPEQEEEPWLRP